MLMHMFLVHMTDSLLVREACSCDAGMESQMDQRDVLLKS